MGWRQPACLRSFEDPVKGLGGTILSPLGSAVSAGRNSSWTSAGGPQQAGGMKTKPGEAKMGPQRLPRPQAGGRQQPHGEWATEDQHWLFLLALPASSSLQSLAVPMPSSCSSFNPFTHTENSVLCRGLLVPRDFL